MVELLIGQIKENYKTVCTRCGGRGHTKDHCYGFIKWRDTVRLFSALGANILSGATKELDNMVSLASNGQMRVSGAVHHSGSMGQ